MLENVAIYRGKKKEKKKRNKQGGIKINRNMLSFNSVQQCQITPRMEKQMFGKIIFKSL